MTYEEAYAALKRGDLEWRTQVGTWIKLRWGSEGQAQLCQKGRCVDTPFNRLRFQDNVGRYRICPLAERRRAGFGRKRLNFEGLFEIFVESRLIELGVEHPVIDEHDERWLARELTAAIDSAARRWCELHDGGEPR